MTACVVMLEMPAGAEALPHLHEAHASDEPFRGVIARTDPNEQESVILLDEQGRAK